MFKKTRRMCVERLETRKLLASIAGVEMLRYCTPETSDAVEAGNIAGLRAATMQFRYDTDALDIGRHNVKAGAAWGGEASVIARVDEAAGMVHVFVFSANPITATAGNLVEFDFSIVNQIASDIANQIELTSIQLNEGQIETTLQLVVDFRGSTGESFGTRPSQFKQLLQHDGLLADRLQNLV